MFYCFSFSAYIRFFIKSLIETNVNISNELYFSDVYRHLNYNGSLVKFYMNPFGVNPLGTRLNVVFTSINPRKINLFLKYKKESCLD